MRLFLPMLFGVLVVASVTWGQVVEEAVVELVEYTSPENNEGEEVGTLLTVDDKNIVSETAVPVTEIEDLPFSHGDPGCIGSGECGPNDVHSGFDVVTGDLGLNGHATPDVNKFTLQTLTSGFNTATGVTGSGVDTAVKDAGNLKTINSGFNAITGEMGLPIRTIECMDKKPTKISLSYGEDYDVLYNVSPMTEEVSCGQTVTYATSADCHSIIDLPALIARWHAPMSIAVHASGTDFHLAIDSIRFLKSCAPPLTSQFVSFHIYWHKKHRPQGIRQAVESLSQSYNCSEMPPWFEIRPNQSYNRRNGLFHPRKSAQNIAKLAAVTHYIMVADFGYWPSENLASEFIKMITRNAQQELTTPNPKVFVLMDFIVNPHNMLPYYKVSLMHLLNEGYAISRRGPCEGPAVSPDPEWYERPQTKHLYVSTTLKRNGTLQSWSPVFIGTANDPDFDQRVSLSGEKTRDWLLCAQDYEFLILDNAFVTRHEGIFETSDSFADYSNRLAEDIRVMQNVILPEYQLKYGRDKGCVM